MKERLNIEQATQTVQRLSPRQVQYVRLLEMSGPELEEEVLRQLDDNPAIEAVDAESPGSDTDAPEASTLTGPQDSVISDPDDDPEDNVWHQAQSVSAYDSVRQMADDAQDLNESLLAQLGEYQLDPVTEQIARYIIGNIDANGYLTRSLAEMHDDIEINTGIEIDDKQMRLAFETVRSMDPAGVGAVDLRDCLLLQLKRIKPVTLTVKEAQIIISDYFDLLSKKHLDRLQAQVGIKDKKEMQAALEQIRTLNPKPGSALAANQTTLRLSHITPDVSVEATDDGKYAISLLSNIPQLQIEKSFAVDPVNSGDNGGTNERMMRQAQAFIRLKREEAETFISALKQRANTMIAVTEAIVRLQPEFFATGEQSRLRPMVLKDISALTGLDISVISRATASKYLATNNGTYPFKMFFSESPTEAADTSTHQLQHILQEIIDTEDKSHPLSDEAIREAMAARGLDVARRTVTKYREKLGIPVGRLRKTL